MNNNNTQMKQILLSIQWNADNIKSAHRRTAIRLQCNQYVFIIYLLNDTVTANCGQYNKVIQRFRAIFAFAVYLFSVFLKHFCLMRVFMYSPLTH